MVKKYDVAVIGVGSGGLTAAATAKGFFQKVVLIERENTGGECTWSGCVPSKALINYAEDAHAARKLDPNIKIDTAEAMKAVRQVIADVYEEESPEVLEKSGYDIVKGFAKFVDKNTLDVDGQIIKAKKIIISTGSSPMVPPIAGLDKIDYHTNETIFKLERLPESMIVLGGGPIGVELAQAMNRLGVKITLVEMMPRILIREEEEYAAMITKTLEEEGLTICTGAKAVEACMNDGKVCLKVEKDGKEEVITGDSILLSLGRVPNIKGMDLEKAGIEYTKKGITVDEHMETSAKGVYAVGDVTGPYQFSHMANVQGILATQNAILPINRKIDYTHVAWCTFTEPELARAGLTEQEAKEKYGEKNVRVFVQNYNSLERAKAKLGSYGEVKMIVDNKGRILGATVIGDRAGEIICYINAIKTLGISMAKLTSVIHPYPTYGEIMLKLAKRISIDNLFNLPVVKQVMGKK